MTTKKNYNINCDCRGMYEDEIVESILEYRGIGNTEHFLNPTEEDLLPLGDLKNIDIAAKLVFDAVLSDTKILVYFDTDLDGISSGAIMTRYLTNSTDNNIDTYINSGKAHGLNGQDLSQFYDYDLIIIVDSLDNNIDNYKDITSHGVKIVILDHHAINSEIPYDDYVCLVSSQRAYGNPFLSGAGVTWKFCKYLDRMLETDYADCLVDLAACGIVGDMMDMTNMENRYIVSKGLEKIYNPAIKKIVGGFEFNSTAIAFSLAPLVNSANRMGKNNIAMMAFLADNNKEVLSLVKKLKACKEEQNEEVSIIMDSVLEQCESQIDKKMIVVETNTQYGINGLIANKLVEKYQRPIIVVNHFDEKYVGSMRAIGVDDFRMICNNSGFAQADGHELASGIMIHESNMDKFKQYVEDNLILEMKEEYDIDARINITDITRTLVDKIKQIDRVSGNGHKPITFYVDGIDEYEIGQMSNFKHLVVKPYDNLYIIKWNWNGSFDDMEDSSALNEEICAVGTLDSGFFGRKFVLKMICNDIEVVA